MNFRHDFAEMAREEFRNLGMSVPKEWDDYEICIKLFQVLQRHINSNIPYYVLYSKELLQKLPYLPESDRREIKRIEWCLRNCQSITEYMSRDINTTSMRKSDFMLKNWEIYHVHLEKVQKKIKDEEWYDEESFKRISPLGTRHVNFLGKYVFNEDKVKTEDGLRDLYLKK